MLVTDRPDRSAALAATLRTVGPCEVVGPDESWASGGFLLGVVSDLALTRPEAARCLRGLGRRYKGQALPVIGLLRRATIEALRHAKTLGATVCLPAYLPPETVAAALTIQIENSAPAGERAVVHGVARAGEALTSLLAEARSGSRIRMETVEAGLAPILTAVQEGASRAGSTRSGRMTTPPTGTACWWPGSRRNSPCTRASSATTSSVSSAPWSTMSARPESRCRSSTSRAGSIPTRPR